MLFKKCPGARKPVQPVANLLRLRSLLSTNLEPALFRPPCELFGQVQPKLLNGCDTDRSESYEFMHTCRRCQLDMSSHHRKLQEVTPRAELVHTNEQWQLYLARLSIHIITRIFSIVSQIRGTRFHYGVVLAANGHIGREHNEQQKGCASMRVQRKL